MKNNNDSSSLFHHRNPNVHHGNDQCHKPNVFICEFCDKVFTSGQALGGHKTSHRSNKQIHNDHHHGHKTIKITFSLSSDHTKHSWTRVFRSNMAMKKANVHPPTASTLNPSASTLNPSEQQELPVVDLLSLLPPRLYTTKKRCRRYLVHDRVANNNTAPNPIPLLDMSRESVVNPDNVNHRECKRMKLSSNGNDTEMMHKPFVPLTRVGIDETMMKEEKNVNEGETAVSRFVRNFDLNELPANDVETELGPMVVCNFKLNELPTNDVADEIIHHE